MAFNKVILMGRLTAAPELKQTNNGTAVTNFTLAVDRRPKEGQDHQADFISITAWKATAEFICRYFGKGSAMLVCGELHTRSWEDGNGNKRYATEVVASEVSFCEAKKNSEGSNNPQQQNAVQSEFGASVGVYGYNPYPAAAPAEFEAVKDDGDLPF